MAMRSARTLSRYYAKLAVISSVPLIVLIVALAYNHYSQQHAQRLEDLRSLLNQRHQSLQLALGATGRHVDQMRRWAEGYLTAEDRRLSRLLPLLMVEADPKTQDLTGYFLEKGVDELQPDATGNFIGGSLALAGGSDAIRFVSLALEVFSIQQLGHVANPSLTYSYFMPARQKFVSVYPAMERSNIRGLSEGRGMQSVLNAFFNRAAYRDGTPQKDPEAIAYWTGIEPSPLTGKKVISHAAPVYDAGRFIGVVGADLLQKDLGNLVRVPKFSSISGRITNDKGQVLVEIGQTPAVDYQVIPVPEAGDDTAAGLPDFVRSDGHFLLRLPLNVPGWHVDYAIPNGTIFEGIVWRFLPFGMILLGLIATLVFGQLLVRSQFVQPVLTFAQYIRDGARGEPVAPPTLPRVWKPWLSMLKATFERSNEAVERLRNSEDRYRRLVELSPDAIMLHDRDGITFVNPAACKVLGFSDAAQANNSSYIDFVAEEEKVAASKRVAEVMEFNRDIPLAERKIRSADGREKFIEVTATPFTNADGEIVALVIFRDVSARKTMERAVRDSELRFRAISEAIPVPILISDRADQTLKYINPAACNHLAIDADFLDSLTIFTLCRDQRFRERLKVVTQGERRADSRELEVTRPNGKSFWARVTTVPMTYQGGEALIHAVVDLTERVEAEAELARQRGAFHQKEKIAALGSLLAGVAHELNNPLSVVTGQALMMEEAVTEDSLSRRARRIRHAAERCSRIVRTFLAMARSRSPARGLVDVNRTVESALDLASFSLQSSGVELTLDLNPDLPALMADGDQLHHVVSNLAVNAEQALRTVDGPRRLDVRTEFDAEHEQVVLTVADTGPGIPKDVAERIFEPFFTTKSESSGTGIGLSLCRDIVTSLGGEIGFEHNQPRGTVFTVRLPLKEGKEASSAVPRHMGVLDKKGRVLVVDDDEDVAHTLADVLRMSGHEVETVYSGEDGIERASQFAFDVIISDVRMPGLDGPGLYRALRERHADLDKRFLFMTGDTLGVDVAKLVGETGITVIEKPLDPPYVAGLVAERLRGIGPSSASSETVHSC